MSGTNRRSIEIAPGLITDDTSFRVGQGGYVDISNMRPWNGSMQTIGGWEALSSDTLTGTCRGIHSWRDSSGDLNIAFGTNSKLLLWKGGDLFDITPTDLVTGLVDGTGGRGFGTGAFSTGNFSEPSTGDFFPLTWSLDNFGDNLIANARGQKIWRWQNDTSVVAAIIPNAPTQVNFIAVTSSRQIVAYGCNEEVGDAFNPRCIRFCDIEDPEDWTTSTTNNAGEFILRNAGTLLSARHLGDGQLVLTDEGAFYQQFVGSESTTFRFTRIGTNCGIIGPRAVSVLGQRAMWMSPDARFWTVTVGGAPQRVPGPLEREIGDNLATVQDAKIYAGTVSEFGEIWWFYPDSRDGNENSRYVAYSVPIAQAGGNPWFAGVLDRTAWHDASPSPHVIGADPDGNIYWHERGRSANGGMINWHAETGDIALSDGTRALQVRGMWPDFEDQQGPINVSVITRFDQRGVKQTHGPFAVLPTTSQVPFRATGNIMSLRFEGAAGPTFGRLGKLTYDATARGRR
ncbi:MAG: hypothetical protein AAGA08_16870 [Pseudomonadota bacterium]